MKEKALNPRLLGRCGFYCGSCPTYNTGGCPGCSPEGAGKCHTYHCVSERDLQFCGQCEDFPCRTILQKQRGVTIFNRSWLSSKARD